MVRSWKELNWSSLTQRDQVNVITKKHLTKEESKRKRKAARVSRKRNRR